jgi:hypothetical protein
MELQIQRANAGSVRASYGTHANDLSLDQLDAVIGLQYSDFGEAVVLLDIKLPLLKFG